MNSNSGNQELVLDVLDNYLEPQFNLLGMQSLHRDVFGEEKRFGTWREVKEEYRSRQWSDSMVAEFVRASKQLVDEGSRHITETYFQIVHPETVSPEVVKQELRNNSYIPEIRGEGGFQFNEENNHIRGRYIFSDINTELTYSGSVKKFVQEHAVPFSIYLEKELLTVEDTNVANIQKIRDAFNRYTSLKIETAGSLTSNPSEASDSVGQFIQQLNETELEGEEVQIERVEEVFIRNVDPEMYEEVEQIEISGDDIYQSPFLREKLDEGWVMQGLVLVVRFNDEIYRLVMKDSDLMSYIKIENIQNANEAKSLIELSRSVFLDTICY